jgi:hypothetical protein
MSWSLVLRADRAIAVCSVQTALQKIAATDGVVQPQEWGWSCAVDVSLPRGRTLTLSGADFSRDDAKEFASKLASALRRLHLKISVGNINS